MSATRYLAVTGQPDALRAWLSSTVPPRNHPQRLNRQLDEHDLVIYTPPETPLVRLEEGKGLVVGRLFRGSADPTPVTALSLSESRHAAWSSGGSLLENKWGGYVAFLRDEGSVTALRDPSGSVPAYCRQTNGLHLFASHPQMLEEFSGAEIDEEFVRQWLSFPFLRTARTGASGWTELLPGTCSRSNGSVSTIRALWSPWKAAAPERRIDDFDEAARRVREVAGATVPAQTASVPHPILQLSGGLDSSIVAACLKAAGLEFKAANFVTAMPDGDERDYARAVASALGVELAELPEDRLPLELAPTGRTLRPPLSPVLQPLHRALARHARATGSRDFITGAGGDNLFCYLTTAAPILDAASDLGLRRSLKTLQDVATLGECTIWKAGRFALRKRFRRAKRPPWKQDLRFLDRSAIAPEPDPHPWLSHASNARPGTVEHIESLVRAQYFVEPESASGQAVHHPLLNQPLMELCLAIPSWLWVRGGRNRAVARAAFSDLLPNDIIHRRTKGRLESMAARAYSAHRGGLAELLLDGELSKRGLLDRPRLETYLGIAGQPPDESYYRIFDLASLELWLRSWRG